MRLIGSLPPVCSVQCVQQLLQQRWRVSLQPATSLLPVCADRCSSAATLISWQPTDHTAATQPPICKAPSVRSSGY